MHPTASLQEAEAGANEALRAARDYLARGWMPLPIAYREKRPPEGMSRWQHFRTTEAELARHFGRGPCNVGVLLGEPSGGLVDVDLDCPEALTLADRFLPASLTFGRQSTPAAHRLYVARIERREEFRDLPPPGEPANRGKEMVEIRSTGGQTVFPGSVHVSGEAIRFDNDLPVLEVEAAELRACVGRLATAALLVRNGWPEEHACILAERGHEAGQIIAQMPAELAAKVRAWLGLQPAQRERTAPAAGTSWADEVNGRGVRDAAAALGYQLDPPEAGRIGVRPCPCCRKEKRSEGERGDGRAPVLITSDGMGWECYGGCGSSGRASHFIAAHVTGRAHPDEWRAVRQKAVSVGLISTGMLESAARLARERGPTRTKALAANARAAPATLPAAIIGSNLTDAGNAQRIVALHGLDMRFCHAWGRWLAWDGRRWRADDTGEAMRRAKDTALAMYDAISSVDGEQRNAFAKWAQKSESATALTSALKLAQSEPGIPVRPNDLDRHPFLLNVANGTLDLRTGELREARREDMLTAATDVPYEPAAECPQWLAFLDRIFASDTDLIGFVQRLFGLCLTGDVSEQVIVWCHGGGANGKGVLLGVLLALVGKDYGTSISEQILSVSANDAHPTELAGLFGKRVAVCPETQEGMRLNESLMKRISGGDKITARRMREDMWEFDPTAKLLISTQHKPKISGTDHGIWRRQRLVPFDVTIPKDEQDPHLKDRLTAELPGILAWAVAGCLAWQREGLGVPEAVERATSDYRAEQDVLRDFLETCCVFDPSATVTKPRMRNAYRQWARESGAELLSDGKFKERLKSRGVGEARKNVARYWTGIALTVEGEQFARAGEPIDHGTRRVA